MGIRRRGPSREFLNTPFVVNAGELSLTIHGFQYAGGSPTRSVMLRLEPDQAAADLTPQGARQLAVMLQNFADTCELLDEAKR